MQIIDNAFILHSYSDTFRPYVAIFRLPPKLKLETTVTIRYLAYVCVS